MEPYLFTRPVGRETVSRWLKKYRVNWKMKTVKSDPFKYFFKYLDRAPVIAVLTEFLKIWVSSQYHQRFDFGFPWSCSLLIHESPLSPFTTVWVHFSKIWIHK